MNKVEIAVQWSCMFYAVFANFVVMVIQFII